MRTRELGGRRRVYEDMRAPALGLMVLALGCFGVTHVEDWEVAEPGMPEAPTIPEGKADVHGPETNARPRDTALDAADPCNEARGHVAALCEADSVDGDCVGFACIRTTARTALECLLEGDHPTEAFEALSRASNPVTRVYAREALLRRNAMTLALVREGIADFAVVPAASGCIGWTIIAAEPAVVGLQRRRGEEADALRAELLETSQGRELASAYDEPRAGLTHWTREYGCPRPPVPTVDDTAEPSRLRELERRYREAHEQADARSQKKRATPN